MLDIEQNDNDYQNNNGKKQIPLSTLIIVIIALITIFAIILVCVISNLTKQSANVDFGEPEDFSARNSCYRYK